MVIKGWIPHELTLTLISAESDVSLCAKLLLPFAHTVCRSCLTPNHSLELGRSELAVGIAQPAVVGDADKVGLGDVDARVEVLAPCARSLRAKVGQKIAISAECLVMWMRGWKSWRRARAVCDHTTASQVGWGDAGKCHGTQKRERAEQPLPSPGAVHAQLQSPID